MMKEQRFQKNFYVNRDFYDLLVELKKQMDVDANFYVKLKEFLYQNGIYILNKDDSSGKCQCGILNTADCRQYYHYSCDFGMVKIKNGSQIRIEFDKKIYRSEIKNCRVYFNGEYMILDEMVRKVNGLDRLSPFCTKIKPYGDRKWYYLINILTSYYSTPNVHKFTKTQCAEIINNFYNKNPKTLMNIETSII